jgi:5-formyltetrahydrofolate cyclo-ligase
LDKTEIRREVRRKRKAMDKEEGKRKSHEICEKIKNLVAYQNADVLYAYMAMEGEVLLDELIRDAWSQGKKVAIPKVLGHDMEFFTLERMEEVMVSPMGIREPVSTEIPKGESPVFLMPALAMDREGNRVGQGGGYYDRYLETHPMPVKVGVGFDFQIYPQVPHEPFDIPVDVVITEKGSFGKETASSEICGRRM